MITCPCCKGFGHLDVDETVHFTPSQQRIFDALRSRPRTCAELVDLLYAEREDGGPDFAATTVHVFVNQMRGKLKPHGMTIRSGGGPGAVYRLEAL